MKFDVPSVVINKLFEQGYEEQILDTVLEFENDSSKEVSDIPLSINNINNNGKQIIFSEEVSLFYNDIINKITNPNTANEIPYVLLGKIKVIDGVEVVLFEKVVIAIKDKNKLNDLSVSLDEDTFRECISNEDYDVISIGHTHGNVNETLKNNSLARNISNELREKYQIRDTGLNLSVADIWQHEAFKAIASESGKKVLQTIIMYNGEVVVVDSDNINKFDSVYKMENSQIKLVSSFEDVKEHGKSNGR